MLRNIINDYQPFPDVNIDDGQSSKCVHALNGDQLGLWSVSSCEKDQAFICEYPRKGFTTVPPPTTTTPPPEAKYESHQSLRV